MDRPTKFSAIFALDLRTGAQGAGGSFLWLDHESAVNTDGVRLAGHPLSSDAQFWQTSAQLHRMPASAHRAEMEF
ncbi:hypothetical protein [Rhizobium sp. PL01]|jgi:hypothetical protein|uniref:hypothetical protein n=1 Tax=Rhizobium sp. PL01 TaxID=3085631 RepID=UPI002982AABA|nr:hypothetical protein [Rhizobium sp. PL01]